MHIYTLCSEQLSLLQVQSQTDSTQTLVRQEPGVGETEGPQWTCASHYNTQETLHRSNPKKLHGYKGKFSVTPI